MAQFLNKGGHIFIPFHRNGMSVGYKGPYIYKSIQTAMANYGKDADEVVEYAPIVRCGKCRHFVPDESYEPEFWDGTCLYNNGCYVYTDDFCSRGEARRDTEVKGNGK